MDYDEVLEFTEEFRHGLFTKCKAVPAEHCGLDRRCGTVWIGEDFLASDAPRLLDYYGGFEYVDSAYKTIIGGVTIYSTEDKRVAAAHERGEYNAEAA